MQQDGTRSTDNINVPHQKEDNKEDKNRKVLAAIKSRRDEEPIHKQVAMRNENFVTNRIRISDLTTPMKKGRKMTLKKIPKRQKN